MNPADRTATARRRSIVMLCDWLPPDFGAVGQYELTRARRLAETGCDVHLYGLSTAPATIEREAVGTGTLHVHRLHRDAYDKGSFRTRAAWTLFANVALIRAAWRRIARADELRITGSPPLLLHFAMPAAWLLRVPVRYRITDFHPECMIAAMDRAPVWIKALQALTVAWRRRVDRFEVLALDAKRRLVDLGIPEDRIELSRDGSPVSFGPTTMPAPLPPSLSGRRVVLYSGNWGTAHDWRTFVDGFIEFDRRHPGVAGVWLNAIGAHADLVERALTEAGVVVHRSAPVPLERLASVLKAADLHIVALSDAFVGYVLPSKTYACIASGGAVLFVGSHESDVHLLCSEGMTPQRYRRADIGDAAAVTAALSDLLGSPVGSDTQERMPTAA